MRPKGSPECKRAALSAEAAHQDTAPSWAAGDIGGSLVPIRFAMTWQAGISCTRPCARLAMRWGAVHLAYIDCSGVRRLLHGSGRLAKFVNHSHDPGWFVKLDVAVQGSSCRAIHRIHRAQTLPR